MKRLIPRVIVKDFEPGQHITETKAYFSKLYKDFYPTGTALGQMKIFEAQGADEIQLVFTMQARHQLDHQVQLLELVSAQLSTPLAVGGGIRSFETAHEIFDTGVERILVSYNPLNLDVIQSIASRYGAQAVCLSLDYQMSAGEFLVRCGSGLTKEPYFFQIPLRARMYGAGEVSLNCIDRDGTSAGLDCDTLATVAQEIDIPLLVGCGAGKIQDFEQAYRLGADGVISGWYFARKDQGCEQVRNRLISKGVQLRAA